MPDNSEPPLKITPNILHDLPLQNDDHAAFHFDEFAVTLARLIASKETRTPLTIGVSGTWGAGKTTLLHRLRAMLEPSKKIGQPTVPETAPFINPLETPGEKFRPCRTVWFNAWKYAGEEALLVALMRVIVQEMFADDFISKSAATLLEPFTERRNVIETVLSWFSIKVGETGVKMSTGVPKETPFGEKAPLLDLFDEVFDKLMNAWVRHEILPGKELRPEEGALVVFIDDLDRCLPAKTVQVLEAVKLFLDKPGCVFVLAADIAQVERAVTTHYQNTGVLPDEKASDYLEKIVQLRFTLPPIEIPKMETFLSEMKVGDNHLITEEWGESWKLLITGAEVNPRKVKTILNDLSLQWAMLVNSGQAQGVDRSDFNTWQVLMRIAPRNFVVRVRDQIDDVELRFKFVMEAIEWVKGNQEVAANYRDYDGSYRLKRVLRQLTFSETFDAATLEAFIYLAAPPHVEIPGRPTTEVAEVEAALEKAGLRVDREPARGEGIPRASVQIWGGLEFIHIPAGKFLMGSKEDNQLAGDSEKPQHTVEILSDYWIGRYPVTNAQFAEFVKATQYVTIAEKEGGWNLKDKYEKGFDWKHPLGAKDSYEKKLDHPVVQVSWDDVQVFCKWLNDLHQSGLPQGYSFRPPTEAEWEKAARGEYGNEWPWGNDFDASKCNSSEGKAGGTTPVGAYSPQGDSPYGAVDMAGNVWEWTNSLFKGYPYDAKDGREKSDDHGLRVLRGGAFNLNPQYVRAAFRLGNLPDLRHRYLGFRVGLLPIF